MNVLLKERETACYLSDPGAELVLAWQAAAQAGAAACGAECLVVVLEGYGLSETSPVASFNHPHGTRKAGSIGTPIAGVEMKVGGDDGQPVPDGDVRQIFIRGHNVMKGYWQRPDATARVMKDGWFATADMARRDEDGLYSIVDCKKDLIIAGGDNVYPREVDELPKDPTGKSLKREIAVPETSR